MQSFFEHQKSQLLLTADHDFYKHNDFFLIPALNLKSS